MKSYKLMATVFCLAAMAGCGAGDGEAQSTIESEARGTGSKACRQLFDTARTTLAMPSESVFMSRCAALPSTLVDCLVHDYAMKNQASCLGTKARAPQPALSALYAPQGR